MTQIQQNLFSRSYLQIFQNNFQVDSDLETNCQSIFERIQSVYSQHLIGQHQENTRLRNLIASYLQIIQDMKVQNKMLKKQKSEIQSKCNQLKSQFEQRIQNIKSTYQSEINVLKVINDMKVSNTEIISQENKQLEPIQQKPKKQSPRRIKYVVVIRRRVLGKYMYQIKKRARIPHRF